MGFPFNQSVFYVRVQFFCAPIDRITGIYNHDELTIVSFTCECRSCIEKKLAVISVEINEAFYFSTKADVSPDVIPFPDFYLKGFLCTFRLVTCDTDLELFFHTRVCRNEDQVKPDKRQTRNYSCTRFLADFQWAKHCKTEFARWRESIFFILCKKVFQLLSGVKIKGKQMEVFTGGFYYYRTMRPGRKTNKTRPSARAVF